MTLLVSLALITWAAIGIIISFNADALFIKTTFRNEKWLWSAYILIFCALYFIGTYGG